MAPRYEQFVRFTSLNGYKSRLSMGGPDADPNTIWRGRNFWIRAGGRLKPIKGVAQVSAQAVGSRIYPLDIYRGTIDGDYVSGRIPKESLVRYKRSALFFVSENTDQQVRINESTSTPFDLTGVTTSPTSRKLRVAILNDDGVTYTVYDAGLDAPPSIGTVTAEANGTKSMNGVVSIRAAARRIKTDTTSNPTEATVVTLSSGGTNRIRVVLEAMATGQDGWVFSGTNWGRGNLGPWKVIREFQTSFDVFATNGSADVTGTNLSQNLRNGDRVTIDGNQYYIAGGTNSPTLTDIILTSNSNGTGTTPFVGTTDTYTLTIDEVILDYRDGELRELIDFDNDPPPLLDGILLFNDVPFGWSGNELIPSKIGNPEAFPRTLRRTTQSGSDIVHALSGNTRIYLMTQNGLEVVTFTQLEDSPFLIRQAWGFGFSSPAQGVVAEGSFFGAVGTDRGVKIVRTREDQSPDFEFSQDVEFEMLQWDIADVVMGFDPANAAVLAMENDGTNTLVLPYMLQLGAWSIPQDIDGIVTYSAVISNDCNLIIDDGSTFTTYLFEGGDGTSIDKYVAWPWQDAPSDGFRKLIKRITTIADADALYIYRSVAGDITPDVTVVGVATAGPFNLATGLGAQKVINTNVRDARLYTIRIDSAQSDAEVQEVSVFGLVDKVFR